MFIVCAPVAKISHLFFKDVSFVGILVWAFVVFILIRMAVLIISIPWLREYNYQIRIDKTE
ncbi:MAG TPA: hypothetical protein VMC41_01370, partial [Candidatus Nanoarchaeia archaeon]|nr:hypothetical protein [Candidatus Nanoarchaeia archaeon]